MTTVSSSAVGVTSPTSDSVVSSRHAATSSASQPYNILTLTEIRTATWSRIYAQGLATGNASLTTSSPPTWKQFDLLMLKPYRYIAVHCRHNSALGWIATFPAFPALSLGLTTERPVETALDPGDRIVTQRSDPASRVSGGVLEFLVFVAKEERRNGLANQLLAALVESLDQDPRWSTLQATVFPENEAALRLLLRHDFLQVGMRRKVGRMKDGPRKGQWRDVLIFEKRLRDLSDAEPVEEKAEQVDTGGVPASPHDCGSGRGDPSERADQQAPGRTVNPLSVSKRPRFS